MGDLSSQPQKNNSTRQENWARPVGRLDASGLSSDAVNLNVSGRQVTSPLNGFGQMWQKTYRIRFDGVQISPQEVVRVWKENFSSFWPAGNHFYAAGNAVAGSAIRPGDVAVLNLAGPGGINAPGGAPMISTGILVIYADEESFSFITPQGHMFAGMNTFSAYEENGVTYAQIQALIRASDPLYELTFRLGLGHKMEDGFWMQTLRNLAARFNATGQPTLDRVLVDSRLQWSEAKNLWHNAAIRTTFYLMGAPFRWVGRRLGGSKRSA